MTRENILCEDFVGFKTCSIEKGEREACDPIFTYQHSTAALIISPDPTVLFGEVNLLFDTVCGYLTLSCKKTSYKTMVLSISDSLSASFCLFVGTRQLRVIQIKIVKLNCTNKEHSWGNI